MTRDKPAATRRRETCFAHLTAYGWKLLFIFGSALKYLLQDRLQTAQNKKKTWKYINIVNTLGKSGDNTKYYDNKGGFNVCRYFFQQFEHHKKNTRYNMHCHNGICHYRGDELYRDEWQ